MKYFNIFIYCMILLCTGCSDRTTVSVSEISASKISVSESPIKAAKSDVPLSTEVPAVVVHVCGAVVSPGVYTLSADARCTDAIQAAGGFADTAATFYLNLASIVEDGMQLYVPTVQEVEDGNVAGAAADDKRSETALINLNTATLDQLMELPGIGESKAATIIAYREEHGSFKSIDELKNISGIKDGTFEKLKPYITVK